LTFKPWSIFKKAAVLADNYVNRSFPQNTR